MNLDFSVVPPALPFLLRATVLTIILALASQFWGTVGGFVLALGRISSIGPLRWLVQGYVWIFRGTPLLLHLFLIYYGGPLVGVTLDAVPAAIIGMSIGGAAYNCEIIRAGLQSVGRGQIEAAQAVGMRWFPIIRRIVVPQALTVIIPPYMSNFISLTKSTSLASVVTVPELMMTAENIYGRNYRTIEILAVTGAIYLVLTTLLTLVQMLLERQFDTTRRRVGQLKQRRFSQYLAPRTDP
jgi:His/Glu/Gln/Arg/opine family amino acid ABC transporter permease subunit